LPDNQGVNDDASDGTPAIFNADECARELGVHPQTFRRYARQHILPAYKIGGRWFMSRDDLLRTKLGIINGRPPR
jgi:excisionase family DNA binding protein